MNRYLLSAACAFAFIFTSQAQNAELTDAFARAATIQATITKELREGKTDELEAHNTKLNKVGETICAGMQQYLPEGDTYTWDCTYNSGLLYVISNAADQPIAQMQVFYHEKRADPRKRGMFTEVLDYPAMHIKDQRIWLLAGNIEIRLNATSDKERDAKLLTLLKSLDLAALAKL